MNDFPRDRQPSGGSTLEQLRHHGIAVSDLARVSLGNDEGVDEPAASATRMLEWMRRYPSMPEIAEPAD